MSRFASSNIASNDGGYYFALVIDTSVSDRTVTAVFKLYCTSSTAPYYLYKHEISCYCGETSWTWDGLSSGYPSSASDWVTCSETINGKTYKKCYTIPTGGLSYTVGSAATSVSLSFSYSASTTTSYVIKKGTHSVSGSESFSAVSLWNDINAYYPDGSSQNGLKFNLSTSDGSSWTGLTNEPDGFTKAYGTTATISGITNNATGIHYTSYKVSDTGATGTSTSLTWTFLTASAVVHLYSAYNTYTIAYNANGGSGAPSSQTKTYGTNLTLSSTKPSRTYYTFQGWSTSSSATSASYSAGGTLSTDLSTTNGATVTLYAVWKANAPTSLSISRSSSTTSSITVKVSATGLTMTNYTVYYKTSSATSYSSKSLGTSTSGTISGLSADTDYTIYFTATNAGGTTTSSSVTYSTLLSTPSITTPTVSDLLPFSCTITATGSISPSRTLTYRFSKDGGSTWTSYQSSNSYSWTGLSEETTYSIQVQVKAAHTGTNASDTTATSSVLSVTTPADQAKIRRKVDGVWEKGKAYYKVNGTWEKAKKVYIKVDGTWKVNSNDD